MEEINRKNTINQYIALFCFISISLLSIDVITNKVITKHLSFYPTINLPDKTDKMPFKSINDPNKNQIKVTASGKKSKLTKYSTPTGNVLGTIETDKKAIEILDSFKLSKNEQAIAVMKDGTSVAPVSCTNHNCTFEVTPSDVYFVVHTHVKSKKNHFGLALLTNKKREIHGPGDHAFPVLSNAPNYVLTPKGAIRVLEFKNGEYYVRTLRGTESSAQWSPADSRPSRREIKKAMRKSYN
ncbi:MAG: hypothetical protein HRT37_17715 [Alteromonadaceae bacterium]|nr:hypothetical protein [Alteromonadaceae bacterium]